MFQDFIMRFAVNIVLTSNSQTEERIKEIFSRWQFYKAFIRGKDANDFTIKIGAYMFEFDRLSNVKIHGINRPYQMSRACRTLSRILKIKLQGAENWTKTITMEGRYKKYNYNRLEKPLKLEKIFSHMRAKEYDVFFNPSVFPSLIFRRKNGVIFLSSSGEIKLQGFSEVKEVYRHLVDIETVLTYMNII